MKPGKIKVLVVDDEQSFIDGLKVGLEAEGFEVFCCNSGKAAMHCFDEVAPDVVLLDVVMPDSSGVDVCRWVRGRSEVPVIIVSARGDEIDMVIGLEVGADDYMAKPYRLRELVARIRAVLRRGSISPAGDTGQSKPVLNVGSIQLDAQSHRVSNNGKDVQLALKEFELLEYLLQHAGSAVSRSELISHVWGHDYVGDTKTLDVHIKRLRAKLEENPAEPRIISTIRGLGYRLEVPTKTHV